MNQMDLVRQLHLMSAEVNLQGKKLSLEEIGKITGHSVASGWLQLRQEGVFNSYNRYWFLLDPHGGRLRYFAQEGNLKQNLKQKHLSCYDIAGITSLDALEPSDKTSRNPSIRGKFPFEFTQKHTGKSKVRLVADTEEEMQVWMSAIRAAKSTSWSQ